MSRRVVVTGVGLVCALGIGTERSGRTSWPGKSGVGPITHFDATAFDCRIAGEVRDFDPLNWIEKKELKKMGRFIQLALAATDFAMRMAELKITPEIAEATGVYVGSGIGGFDVIEREHSKLLEGGPGRISPFFIPAAIINLASGHDLHSLRRAAGRIPRRPRPARLRRTRWAIPSASSSAATRK